MERAVRLSAFPRHRLIGHELLRCGTNELHLLERLGPPTAQTDPRRHEPRFFWDLEWECGLLTSVAFNQLTQVLTLHLDDAEIDHALRHLDIEPRDLWLWERAEPDRFAEVVRRPPPRTWAVWRIEAEGGRATEQTILTERDARCLAASLTEDRAAAGQRFVAGPMRDDPATAG